MAITSLCGQRSFSANENASKLNKLAMNANLTEISRTVTPSNDFRAAATNSKGVSMTDSDSSSFFVMSDYAMLGHINVKQFGLHLRLATLVSELNCSLTSRN
jgi:hypothetical protein